MKKLKRKAEVLKALSEDMMNSCEGPAEESDKVKATISADSKEGLLKGAEMLPEILEKAEKLKKKLKK